MSPLFSSLDRSLALIRQPLMALRLSVSPDEAVARCITLWRTAKIRCETPGMREQFAQTGWVNRTGHRQQREGSLHRFGRFVQCDCRRHRTVSAGSTRPIEARLSRKDVRRDHRPSNPRRRNSRVRTMVPRRFHIDGRNDLSRGLSRLDVRKD